MYEFSQETKKIRARIRRYERELQKEYERFGSYDDSAGKRDLLGPLYLLTGDLRYRQCQRRSTVYTDTLFANKQLHPTQVILLLHGICKGESSACLARELQLAYDTVHHLRQRVQTQAVQLQPDTPLPDAVIETDEVFQTAGKKGVKHSDPCDPPRRRANKQKGMVRMPMSVPPSWVPLVAKVGKCGSMSSNAHRWQNLGAPACTVHVTRRGGEHR